MRDPEKPIAGTLPIDPVLAFGDKLMAAGLEPAIWQAMVELCQQKGLSVDGVSQELVNSTDPAVLIGAIRTFVLAAFRAAADLEPLRRRGFSESSDDGNDDGIGNDDGNGNGGTKPPLSPLLQAGLDGIKLGH